MSEVELESIDKMLSVIDQLITDKEDELKQLRRQKLKYEQKSKDLKSGSSNGKADNIRGGQKNK